MLGRLLTAALMWLAAAVAWGQQPALDYAIDVTLDPALHRLSGRETLRWVNTTDTPASEIQLHLYLNAFASNRSTFMRELGRGTLRGARRPELSWGWIRVERLLRDDGVDLLPGLEYIRPDDGNPDDYTVARVPLPEPVLPGQRLELVIDFAAQLPRVIARTGFAGDFHLVGQWYPKLGVFEAGADGGDASWSCHQFHLNSEFYADFASYRVGVTVPAGWVVGGSGVELFTTERDDGTRTVELRADRVHDVAWCAAPATTTAVVDAEFDPGEHVPPAWLERAAARLGRSPAELELPPVHLRLLLPESQRELAERMLRAARLAIAWHGLNLGPYPYPQLTIVSPPADAEEAGGMEYQSFITTGAALADSVPVLGRRDTLERVTVHEFGHQYFQGMLASDEFEAPWLDEGFTSWAENACMAEILADGLVPGLLAGEPWAKERMGLALFGERLRIDRRAWEFRRRWDYFAATYTKTAVVLKTLEGLAGEERFARAMRSYVERYRFGHPRGSDFERAFNDGAGESFDWFFAQAVRDDREADWGVLAVRQRRPPAATGMELRDGSWQEIEESIDPPPAEPEPWQVAVELGRGGELVGPVEVVLRFADGREELRTWDGSDRWVRWRLESPARLSQVVVDPRGVWLMETRRADNYWRDEPVPGRAGGPLWWAAGALRVVAAVASPWS